MAALKVAPLENMNSIGWLFINAYHLWIGIFSKNKKNSSCSIYLNLSEKRRQGFGEIVDDADEFRSLERRSELLRLKLLQ
jgi:hypothetical protein